MVTMVKDLFGRHAPLRCSGFEIRYKTTGDVSFLTRYKRSECAEFNVTLDFGKFWYSLYDFRLSFCLACGRFLGFGTRYEICWVCEDDLEPECEFEDWLEP